MYNPLGRGLFSMERLSFYYFHDTMVLPLELILVYTKLND